MSFLYPHILWFLFLPALLAGLVALARRKTGNGWLKLVSSEHTDELVTRRPAWRSIIPAALCILALACTIAALARPINGFREAGGLSTGRNLLIALDISRSMETQDVKPSRLEEARAAAYELIDSLPSDKIGLIVFSGDADLVVPLTYDHTALRDALEQVNRNWAGTGGTNFGLVLKRAMQDLKRSAPDGTNALVLLSDGEDTVGSSLDIAEEARKDKLLVITVGVGTAAGGPIPDPKGQNGLWQDADGKHVISKLDADSLRKFSEATGGDFAVLDSNTDLAAFTKNAVRKIDKHEENVSTNKVPNDLFAWFAWVALALLAAAIVIATEWRLPRRGAAAVALLLILSPAAQAAPSGQSVVQYTKGLMQEGKDNANAKEAFSEALLDSDPQMQAAAFYQIGNVGANATIDKLRRLYGEGEQEQGEQMSTDPEEEDGAAAAPQGPKQPSIEDLEKVVEELKKDLLPYENALKIQPGLKPAESNIAKIKQLIKDLEEEIERMKQQQQQQQQNQDQNQDQQQQQNQDQQQQNQQNQNKDNQQKQDQKDQQDQDQQQQNQDQQNQQDKQNQDQQQKDQDQQQGQKDRDKQQQNQDRQQQQEQKEQQAKPEREGEQPKPMTEEEKAQQSAADILRMHLDEEKGSPIPHAPANTVRPPRKDY